MNCAKVKYTEFGNYLWQIDNFSVIE